MFDEAAMNVPNNMNNVGIQYDHMRGGKRKCDEDSNHDNVPLGTDASSTPHRDKRARVQTLSRWGTHDDNSIVQQEANHNTHDPPSNGNWFVPRIDAGHTLGGDGHAVPVHGINTTSATLLGSALAFACSRRGSGFYYPHHRDTSLHSSQRQSGLIQSKRERPHRVDLHGASRLHTSKRSEKNDHVCDCRKRVYEEVLRRADKKPRMHTGHLVNYDHRHFIVNELHTGAPRGDSCQRDKQMHQRTTPAAMAAPQWRSPSFDSFARTQPLSQYSDGHTEESQFRSRQDSTGRPLLAHALGTRSPHDGTRDPRSVVHAHRTTDDSSRAHVPGAMRPSRATGYGHPESAAVDGYDMRALLNSLHRERMLRQSQDRQGHQR